MSKAVINLDLFFRQNVFPNLVLAQDNSRFRIGNLNRCIQTFDAFVRCTLMGNQPWPQFQNGIRERSIMVDSFPLQFGRYLQFLIAIVIIIHPRKISLRIYLKLFCHLITVFGMPMSAISMDTIVGNAAFPKVFHEQFPCGSKSQA